MSHDCNAPTSIESTTVWEGPGCHLSILIKLACDTLVMLMKGFLAQLHHLIAVTRMDRWHLASTVSISIDVGAL